MAPSTAEDKKPRFGRTRRSATKGQGRLSQVRQVYSMTAKADPWLPWALLGVALAVILVCLLLGWVLGGGDISYLIYSAVVAVPLALLACMVILGLRAKRAAYQQIDGMPGASVAALQELGRGWTYEERPVQTEAVGKMRGMRDMAHAAMVFRAVGRPGVVLVCEGPQSAALRLAAAERKRVARVVGEKVPVEIFRVGGGEGGLSAMELPKRVRGLKKVLTADEVAEVTRRLKSLGAARPPVPAGMDPHNARRPSRKAMRGR